VNNQGEENFGIASSRAKRIISKFSSTKKVSKDDYFGTKKEVDPNARYKIGAKEEPTKHLD
jgi:hypothetical protein